MLRHWFSLLSQKNEKVSPPDGTTPPNHEVGRVMASLHPWKLSFRLKGHLSINLVILAVVLLLDGEDFLVRGEYVFMPILGMQLEELLCSYLSDLLQSGSKEVSLQTPVISYV